MEFDSRAITIRLNAIGNTMDELTISMHNRDMEKISINCDILLHLIDIFWDHYTINARFFPEEVDMHFKKSIVKLLEEIYIGLSAFQNSALSPEIAASLMKKYSESFQSTKEQLSLCKDFNCATEPENRHKLDPRIKNDRITALLGEYSSKEDECPYYAPETKSKCLLEPRVIKIIDCEGQCFINGICCQMIGEKLEKMSS